MAMSKTTGFYYDIFYLLESLYPIQFYSSPDFIYFVLVFIIEV